MYINIVIKCKVIQNKITLGELKHKAIAGFLCTIERNESNRLFWNSDENYENLSKCNFFVLT